MTCKGYDPRAVKVSKTVKRMASTIVDNHARGAYIRSFAEIEKSESRHTDRKDKQ